MHCIVLYCIVLDNITWFDVYVDDDDDDKGIYDTYDDIHEVDDDDDDI